MESRHCGPNERIFFCPVHNASAPCSFLRLLELGVCFMIRVHTYFAGTEFETFPLKTLALVKRLSFSTRHPLFTLSPFILSVLYVLKNSTIQLHVPESNFKGIQALENDNRTQEL